MGTGWLGVLRHKNAQSVDIKICTLGVVFEIIKSLLLVSQFALKDDFGVMGYHSQEDDTSAAQEPNTSLVMDRKR